MIANLVTFERSLRAVARVGSEADDAHHVPRSRCGLGPCLIHGRYIGCIRRQEIRDIVLALVGHSDQLHSDCDINLVFNPCFQPLFSTLVFNIVGHRQRMADPSERPGSPGAGSRSGAGRRETDLPASGHPRWVTPPGGSPDSIRPPAVWRRGLPLGFAECSRRGLFFKYPYNGGPAGDGDSGPPPPNSPVPARVVVEVGPQSVVGCKRTYIRKFKHYLILKHGTGRYVA